MIKVLAAGIVVAVASWFYSSSPVTPAVLIHTSQFVHKAAPLAESLQRPWWKDAVIYQIYTRSFQDSNGDGVGDFEGIISRLDYLADLGVDAIWISPAHPTPDVDFGYDVQDYMGINPQFGTLEDFKQLVAEAKKRGIRVIMDLVVNHTSDQHPWFVESRSSKNNPKRDWYIWRDGKDGKEPNNWLSRPGEAQLPLFTLWLSAWTYDAGTTQYYMHSFFREQPDLNWRSPEVRAEIMKVMKYWLDMDIGGFRLDIANYYLKDMQFRDNPMHPSIDFMRRTFYPYDGQQHFFDKDLPETLAIFQDMRKLVNAYDAMLVGEIDAQHNGKAVAMYHGKAGDGLNMAFNNLGRTLDADTLPFTAAAFQESLAVWGQELPFWAQPSFTLSNHDQPRHFSRFGDDERKARIGALLILTLRGTPILYYGEEIGMRQASIAKHEMQDPLMKLAWPISNFLPQLQRDGCRTPMQWTHREPFAGFSRVQPWLKMAPGVEEANVEKQVRDSSSLLNFYRRLIALRKQHAVLRVGGQILLKSPHPDILAYKRTLGDTEALVLLNFGDKAHPLVLGKHQVLFATDSENRNNGALAPYAGVVLITKS